MHGARAARRFVRLRQHSLSKLSALAFVVLILLPFTAPFPTYHLHDSPSGHPYDAVPKEVKDKLDSDEYLTLPAALSLIAPTLHVVDGSSLRRPGTLQKNSRQPTVLRL